MYKDSFTRMRQERDQERVGGRKERRQLRSETPKSA